MERFGLDHKKMSVVNYAFDNSIYSINNRNKRSELGIGNDVFLLGCIARITPQKGHIFLLDAFAHFRKEIPNTKLLLVGADDFNTDTPQQVRKKISELGLQDDVIILGQRADAYEIMAALDIFILPSLWEGFGLVLLEAASLEIPIIASKVSAIPDVVGEHGGILVPPGDPDAITQAIKDIHKNKIYWEKEARLHKEWVLKYFSLDKMLDNTKKVYITTLKKRGR